MVLEFIVLRRNQLGGHNALIVDLGTNVPRRRATPRWESASSEVPRFARLAIPRCPPSTDSTEHPFCRTSDVVTSYRAMSGKMENA